MHSMEDFVAYTKITDTIGNTPLVQIDFGTPATIYAKLEYFNPSGSIKDRSALHMLNCAEQRGQLQSGGTLIEASSGNQGIATAMLGALKGYKTIVTVSEKVSQEKRKTIALYGAQVITCPHTDALHDADSYHAVAQEIARTTPNSYMLNQYYNADNTTAHYMGLGPEIWNQTHGTITHLCAGVGSGGTISGAGRYIKEQNPRTTILGVDSPCSYRSTNGNPREYKLEGLGVDYDTPLLDSHAVDDFLLASDEESIAMFHWLVKHYGICVGPAGAAVAAQVYRYAQTLTRNDTLVMIFGDSGRAYLSKEYCEEPHISTSRNFDVCTSNTWNECYSNKHQ